MKRECWCILVQRFTKTCCCIVCQLYSPLAVGLFTTNIVDFSLSKDCRLTLKHSLLLTCWKKGHFWTRTHFYAHSKNMESNCLKTILKAIVNNQTFVLIGLIGTRIKITCFMFKAIESIWSKSCLLFCMYVLFICHVLCV